MLQVGFLINLALIRVIPVPKSLADLLPSSSPAIRHPDLISSWPKLLSHFAFRACRS